jgi:hypothetical protein
MSLLRLSAFGPLLLLAAACASSVANNSPVCTSDAECPAHQACFAEGCGDPSRGLVVEIRGDALAGQYARDFTFDGGVGPIQDFELKGALMAQGEFLRLGAADPSYSQPVRLFATGESEAIPRVSRSYELLVTQAPRGAYQMPLGTGRFTLTATPTDLSVPPAVRSVRISAEPQPPTFTNFIFPSGDGALTVSGRLVALIDTTRVPAEERPITQGRIDLQAFDPVDNTPLSQRFPVSSGQPGSNGSFTMTLNPLAQGLKSVSFRASARYAGDPVPTKSFVVDMPLPSPLILQMGDFTAPVTVAGRAVDQAGVPVASATVVIGGTVPGGGTFTSQIAVTDAAGVFSLQTIPGQEELSLTVVPPASSAAALTTHQLRVPAGGVSALEIRCGTRVSVSGLVLRPDGSPARGTVVRASEWAMSSFDRRVIPLDDAQAVVDGNGLYSLVLDQATWQLSFASAELPLTTRMITVGARYTALGWDFSQRQETVQLARGRLVSGTVIGSSGPVAFAALRFFLVAPVQGVLTSVLLGSTTADATGRYSVLLPAP